MAALSFRFQTWAQNDATGIPIQKVKDLSLINVQSASKKDRGHNFFANRAIKPYFGDALFPFHSG